MERDFFLDLELAGKAAPAGLRLDDGDVLIEGYAADFNLDREDEFFVPGAFERSIKDFMDKNPALLYHHDPAHQLGVVERLELRDDGLWMRARVAKATDSRDVDIIDKINRGIMRGLSVGGKMRKNTTGKIDAIDLREISITPLPVNPRTLFAVAQKAFQSDEAATEQAAELRAWFEQQIEDVETQLDDIEGKAHTSGRFNYGEWNGSSARFTIAQWRRSTLIDKGGDRDSKSNFSLPVREPNGVVNCRAVGNARARINQVKGAPASEIAKARRTLERLSNACRRAREDRGE